VLIGWGDPLFENDPGLTAKDFRSLDWLDDQAASRQEKRFGTNNDALAFFPAVKKRSAGVLCVNHEYVMQELSFAGLPKDKLAWIQSHPESVAWMQAAHGVSVLDLERGMRGWQVVRGGPSTRRITANTPMQIMGPARGDALMRTNADPSGTTVLGTFANCAGGKTPWGTYLTAEENIQDYFGGARTWAEKSEDDVTKSAYRRWPLRERSAYGWELVDKRFEYVYKFVTRDRFDSKNREANLDLLDYGTLYVARFDANGRGEWLPLVYDENGPLNRHSGFRSQAEVVIKCRAAADVLGATPMDRPEDIEPSPISGRVYMALTKNGDRALRRADFMGREIDMGPNHANPRPNNDFGHIVELIEDNDDASSRKFSWNVFLLAGDPRNAQAKFLTQTTEALPGRLGRDDVFYAGYSDRSQVSPIACPDNLGFDPSGRLWIVTDADEELIGNNGCFVVPTTGPDRGLLKQVLSAPIGAEVCGCEFTPDGTTLFLSIQHPGEGGTVDNPVSHWPDGSGLPARSAVIAVSRIDGSPL
jgi:secreted PhoX family phosphatase